MTKLRFLIAGALLAALAAAPASAQTLSKPPTYGTRALASGFQPDPTTQQISAGGTINVAQTHQGCTGFVADAPDYRVNYTAGSAGLPLIFSVAAASDTTLVVNAPNGQWFCDDDSGEKGLNPQVRFNAPTSGQYDIWVGTYASGALQQSTLSISELTSQ